jgi:hypothetical protein
MTGLSARCAELIRRNAHWLAPVVIVVVTGYAIWCGAMGIDFGDHWDEHYHVAGVRSCVDRLAILPQRYIYGSVYFLVGLAVVFANDPSFLPRFIKEVRPISDPDLVNLSGLSSVEEFQGTARVLLASSEYVLEVRTVFFCLSALASLWVFLTVRKLFPGRHLGAVAAALFIALCWELHYHQRFIAVDALLAQAVAALLFFLSGAWLSASRPSFPIWYGASAAVAAGAFCCKATGLVTLLPVLLLPFVMPRPLPRLTRLGFAVFATIVFGLVTSLLQPATIVDFLRYFATLSSESSHYGGSHLDHTSMTSGPVERVGKVLVWLWLAVPSPYVAAAIPLTLIAGFGVFRFARLRRGLSMLGGVLVAGLCGFLLMHPLQVVRQYLMLLPLMAIAFGVGLLALQQRIGSRWPWIWRTLLAGLVVIFVLNARWLHASAAGIRDATDERILQEVAADLLRHPEVVKLSPQVYAALPARLKPGYRCSPDPSHDPAPVLLRITEQRIPDTFGLSRRLYGPQGANYDWYTSWRGKADAQPIVRLSPGQALRFDVPAHQYARCVPTGAPAP